MKREIEQRELFLLIPCFLAVIFAVIYSWGIWPLFQLATINIICVALTAIEIAQAFTEKINTWKVCGFIDSGAISGIVTAFNVRNDIQDEAFTLSQLSFWSWLSIGLLATSVIALVVVLIRMFRWNQDQWEEIREWRQEYRKERMEARRQLRRSKQEYKQELSKGKATAKIDKQKDQAGRDVKVRNRKHEQRMDRLNDWKKYSENITLFIFQKVKSLATLVVSSLMAVLFLVIPYSKKLQAVVFNWLDAVDELASQIKIISLNNQNNQNKFFPVFANYIIFYIFIIFVIWMIVFLCRYVYKILTGNGKGEDQNRAERKNILEEYDTAIAVLTVFTALLFAFGTSGSSFFDLSNKWTTLITVILFILIVFISIETVRLVVEQIGQKNSLLKRLVRLIFVAILEFLAGLLLGVIISFQIEKVISSLLSMVFPSEELSFTSKIQKKFNEMFSKEVDNDDNDGNDNPTPQRFSKKHIWRRYHKK